MLKFSLKFRVFEHIYLSSLSKGVKIMPININYTNTSSKKFQIISYYLLMKNLTLTILKNILLTVNFLILRFVKKWRFEKKIYVFELSSKKKIILISIKKIQKVLILKI